MITDKRLAEIREHMDMIDNAGHHDIALSLDEADQLVECYAATAEIMRKDSEPGAALTRLLALFHEDTR